MEKIREAYDYYMEKYKKQWAEVKKTMEMLNTLADDLGIEKPFPNIAESTVGGRPRLKADLFVGKALTSAVVEYLNLSGKEVGARPWTEIMQALRDGGFESLPKTKAAEDAARTNCLKSPKLKLIGENSFGLAEWYPKQKKGGNKEEGNEQEDQPEQAEKKKAGRPKKTGVGEQTEGRPATKKQLEEFFKKPPTEEKQS